MIKLHTTLCSFSKDAFTELDEAITSFLAEYEQFRDRVREGDFGPTAQFGYNTLIMYGLFLQSFRLSKSTTSCFSQKQCPKCQTSSSVLMDKTMHVTSPSFLCSWQT
jgi:hypothetical protein